MRGFYTAHAIFRGEKSYKSSVDSLAFPVYLEGR